eukprot:5928881-Ditylum_brightwellii.AAC.1
MASLCNKGKEVREKLDKALAHGAIAPEINIKGGMTANITGAMVTHDGTMSVSQDDSFGIT